MKNLIIFKVHFLLLPGLKAAALSYSVSFDSQLRRICSDYVTFIKMHSNVRRPFSLGALVVSLVFVKFLFVTMFLQFVMVFIVLIAIVFFVINAFVFCVIFLLFFCRLDFRQPCDSFNMQSTYYLVFDRNHSVSFCDVA